MVLRSKYFHHRQPENSPYPKQLAFCSRFDKFYSLAQLIKWTYQNSSEKIYYWNGNKFGLILGYLIIIKYKTMQLRFHEYTCFAFIMFLSAAFSCSQKSNENATELVGESEKEVVVIPKKTILFFGNSLTAGYGIEPEDTFAGIIQQRIDSLGLDYN